MGRFFGPLRISDDRGTPRPLFIDGSVNRYLKYRTEFKLGSPATLAVLLVFVVPMAGMALVEVLRLPVGVMIAVGPPLGIAMFFVAAQVPRRQHAESVRDFLLVSGRCAACGYSLREVEPEHDGCAVCPECGAAWSLTTQRTGHLKAVGHPDVQNDNRPGSLRGGCPSSKCG